MEAVVAGLQPADSGRAEREATLLGQQAFRSIRRMLASRACGRCNLPLPFGGEGWEATVERVGEAAIAFVVLWAAIGLDIAILAAALFVGFELVLRVLSSAPDEEDEDAVEPGDVATS